MNAPSRIKVVHVLTRLDFGGAQQNTLHTVAHLDPARFDAVLLCGPGGRLDGRIKSSGLRAVFVEDLVREISPLRDLAALFFMARFLREERPHIVHTHSSKAGILGRFAAAMAGVPVILHTFHGFGFHDGMAAPLRGLYVLLERWAARYCRRLIFVSKSNAETARRLGIGPQVQTELIRSGVALKNLPARVEDVKALRAEAGIRRDPPLVLSIGNLKPQKNPGDFLKVAEAVCKIVPQVTFAFVGDGPLRSKLEAAVLRRGLSRKVVFLGWREDAARLLAASDVFLMTSLWEGLPRALVEAMKSGLPCVAYAADGVCDVVEDGVNGFLVPLGDWEKAAALVAQLLASKSAREKIGARAADSIGPEFDIDGMVRAQEELYARLIGRENA